MKILWLDDLRNPFIDLEGRVPKEDGTIIWVLNHEQFVQWIEKFGLPDIISFDHDLAHEHYTPEEYWSDYEASKKYQDAKIYQEKTGLDCAKWLVNYCIDNNKPLPKFYIHSANPVGADNIRFYLENFVKNFSIYDWLKETEYVYAKGSVGFPVKLKILSLDFEKEVISFETQYQKGEINFSDIYKDKANCPSR